MPRIDELAADVRFAIRQLKASPGFTAVAAITLALGIGANSAIFALADATLLRPLPFPEPDRLVLLWERTPNTERTVVAPFEFVEWSRRNSTFESMAAMVFGARALVAPDGTAEQVLTQNVSVRFFDVFRVAPLLGRTFVASDDRPRSDVIVLSEALWRGRFAADPTVVGRVIRLDGEPFTVVGIVPAEFHFFTRAGAWTVFDTAQMTGPRGVGHFLRVVGRTAPGVTLDRARSDMSDIAAAIAAERPDLNKGRGVMIEPLRDGLIGGELRLTSLLLAGVVGFVLLMCCANVANLLLARTAARTREIAVRTALGAGRRRIVQQLLTESVVLALLGGLIGAALSAAIVRTAPDLLPQGLLPAAIALDFDARVMAFCGVAAVFVAFLFGAAPAWQATGVSLAQAGAAGSRSATGGNGVRTLLATAEVAAAVLILCGAGLLLRTLAALEDVDPGYRARDVLTMRIALPLSDPAAANPLPYATPESRRRFYDAVEREVAGLPGVRQAAWGSALPLDGWWVTMSALVVGTPRLPEAQRPPTRYHIVSPAYFQTLDIPILEGRAFTDRDTAESEPVCIVNEAFVRRYLGGQSPLETRLEVRGMTTGGAPLPVRQIVGVVRQVRERPDEAEAEPHVYVPLAQDPEWQASLVVRPVDGPAAALTTAVRAAIARIDRSRPVTNIRTLEGIAAEATSRPRFRAALVGAFALLALALALVGVFGLLAYAVQQRWREFGVRIALGATTANVVRLVLGGAARVIAAGTVIGLAAAAALGRSMATFLFGVQPLDPMTFGSVALVLALAAAIAALVPAFRAASVDPAVAFRAE